MKSFEQFKQRMMESFYNVTNAAGGVPMDGITDKGGIVDVYQTWKPKELRRINAYIGAILRGQTLEPDALLMDLRVRLHVIGLDFEPITIDDEDGRFVVQCSHYKGMGWNAKIGDVEEFESAIGNDLYLVLDYWTNDEGYTQLSGKLIPEDQVEEYMEDEEDDVQESATDEMDESTLLGEDTDETFELDEASKWTIEHGKFNQEEGGRLSGTKIFVTGQRKDGKYNITYAYGSGKRINKIVSKEQLEAAIKSVTGDAE